MRPAIVFIALAAAGCGAGSGPGSGADAQALNALAQDVSSTAAAYAGKAASMADEGTCTADETQYDAQVRPMIDEMKTMGPTMDHWMSSLGRSSDADMACAAQAMAAELDRHRGAACASLTDMGPNELEAQQHVATMTQWADHQMVRSYSMGSATGMGVSGGGMGGAGMTTGHCLRSADGSYTLGP